jgi:hypothetical protein
VLLGLGFLAVYGAAVLNPFGRFLLIVAAAAAAMAGGIALVKYRPRWTRWGYWLQSFGAAVFLIGCLGAGGIPGVAWVTNPMAGLGLLVFGVAVNVALGSYRRRQPYLTLHVALSLVALSVADPQPLLILALWTTAFLGLALSWFQRWAYHRAVVVVVAQAILAAAYWRVEHDPAVQWLALGASASLALLVHIASYRKLETEPWSRASFITHVLNALAAAVPCALWSPHLSWATGLTLAALTVALVLLSLHSKRSGTSWLYRTDRVLALAVAGTVLMVNPLGAPVLVLGAVFVGLATALAWVARAENDALLSRVGLGVLTVSLIALAVASLFQFRDDTPNWVGQTVVVFAAIALAGVYSLTAKQTTRWHDALDAFLPPAFLMPLIVLWLGDGSPVPGLSPGWVLIVPTAVLALAARRRDRQPLAWSLVSTAAFVVVFNWFSWLGQGRLWGSWGPTLVWGAGPVLTAAAVILASPANTNRFVTAFLLTLGSAALLAWLALTPVHPALAMAAVSALFIAVLSTDLQRLHRRLPSAAAAVLGVALAVARFAWAWEAPVGWIALSCDLVAAGLLAAAAMNPRSGPALFWEASLIWLIWTVSFDLPFDGLSLGFAVLAAAAVTAGRLLGRSRLDWYSIVPFFIAAGFCVTTGDLVIKAITLAVLIGYVALDSLLKFSDGENWQTKLRPARRYVVVFVQAAVLALCLPAFVNPAVLTLGWAVESALVFFLAVLWKDEIFKNTSLVGLGVCLIRLIWVDLSNSDILVKAISFLSVGGLMVGMNVLYLWSKNRKKSEPE